MVVVVLREGELRRSGSSAIHADRARRDSKPSIQRSPRNVVCRMIASGRNERSQLGAPRVAL